MLKRVKRRYLALKIVSVEACDSKELMDVIWGAVVKLYGEYGASRTGLALIDYNMEERFAVLRAANAAIDMVRAALASITRIRDRSVAIHVLMVSGTIKALYAKAKQ